MLATMETRCLDVDRKEEWKGLYEPWFATLTPAATWAHLYDQEHFVSVDSRVNALARAIAPGYEEPYEELRAKARKFLQENFTHMALYHACRIVDRASYERDGLRLSNIDSLNRDAEAIFGPSELLTDAMRTRWKEGYSSYNHGRIGLFFTRSAALIIGDHYLHEGSEYIRTLANLLESGARPKLGKIGRAALVRCILPLEEVSESDLGFACLLPLQAKLTVRDPEAPPWFYVLQGGTMHERPIPAAWISIEYPPSELIGHGCVPPVY